MATQLDRTLSELLELVEGNDSWLKIERVLRKAARVFAAEAQQALEEAGGVRVNVKSAVRDLGSGALNADLQHFFAGNHRFIALLAEKNRRAAAETYDFVDEELTGAIFNPRQMEVVASKREEIVQLDGHLLDLGVYKGSSTRALARIFPDRIIHGFDSFEGLPGDWAHALKGTFGDVKGVLPDMPQNVRLYKGWFENTLPEWRKVHDSRPVSLLRVDCDIYSSTKTIFDSLEDLIQPGTWIIFDELIGYRGWKEHEYKAFQEFQKKTGFGFKYVAFGLTYAMGYIT